MSYPAKGQLIPVVMFMSIFQAASVLNISAGGAEVGIAPAYVILLIALVNKFVARATKAVKISPRTVRATSILACFVLYATLSAFINPFVFSGVLITNSKVGARVPLEWSPGYLPQVFYLLISFTLYLAVTSKTSPAELIKSLDWYVNGVSLASVIGIYQYVAVKGGLPFPSNLLYTNPSYVIYNAYDINGFLRTNSTFTEASVAALSLSVALALVVAKMLYSTRGVGVSALRALLIALALVLTLSATGYMCLIFVGLLSGFVYLFRWRGTARFKAAKFVLMIPVGIVVLILLTIPAMRQTATNLLHTVLIDKTESFSYQARTQLNEDALQTAADTAWIGAGWGICRASSFIPTALANVGVPGILLLGVFCAMVLHPIRKLHKVRRPLQGVVLFALSTALLNLVVALPDIVHPVIWLLFAAGARLSGSQPVNVLASSDREVVYLG
jgi:hypothetical protein